MGRVSRPILSAAKRQIWKAEIFVCRKTSNISWPESCELAESKIYFEFEFRHSRSRVTPNYNKVELFIFGQLKTCVGNNFGSLARSTIHIIISLGRGRPRASQVQRRGEEERTCQEEQERHATQSTRETKGGGMN